MKIAKVLIHTSVKTLNKVYDYAIPEELEEDALLGKRVEVNFGRGRASEEGIIVKIIEETAEQIASRGYRLKKIEKVLDEVSYIDQKRLQLAKYMAHIYFCNVYDTLKLMLPPGTKSKNSKKSLDTKQDTRVRLIKSHEEIMQDIENESITSAKHIKLLTFLMYQDYVLIHDIIDGLDISRAVIQTVVKNGYIILEKVDKEPETILEGQVEKTVAMTPTPEQQVAINEIGRYVYEEQYQQCLLFGVTGSGKTEVYLQLIEKVLMQGKKALVLVPEISLTYQTISRFMARFGNDVAVLHSKMTVTKRKEEFKRIKRGEVSIVIGVRSAIFAPLDDIGLVIIDEEHDSSYYSATTPKYSTKEVAAYLCKQNNAVLLLGSATPEVTSYYRAKQENVALVTMEHRTGTATLPEIEIVNMKQDRVLGNSGAISLRLKEEIAINMENGQQTMLFLNRRGYLSYLHCEDCATIFKCPNCDVAMTYHKTNHLLHCHYCSHVERNITNCPVCLSEHITSTTLGTQKLEEELKELFPSITTIRMDADTTVAKDAHQGILDRFRDENIHVLIGTQMISKGHDLPNVTLVGILGVDTMLGMDDYLSSEKAFSNLLQVAGRAGRANIAGRVLIQTNEPDHYLLESVIKHDYVDFYEKEIQHREQFGYPPFMDIILFELSGMYFDQVKKEAERLYQILSSNTDNLYKVYSPKSPFIQKLNNKYRINIIMKTRLNSLVYKKLYEKILLFHQQKKVGVHMIVSKNPMFIG